MKFFKKPSHLLLRSNFFTQRVINTWNYLPAEVASAPTISTFKASLDNYWNDIGYGYEQRPSASLNFIFDPNFIFVTLFVYPSNNNKIIFHYFL